MCRLLNMEDVVDDIIDQLGMTDSGHYIDQSDGVIRDGIVCDSDGRGRISFDDFMKCRSQLTTDVRPRLDPVASHDTCYSHVMPSAEPSQFNWEATVIEVMKITVFHF